MKKTKTLLSLAVLGLAMTSSAAFAHYYRTSQMTDDFVTKASSAGAFEITSSELALRKSHNPQVRQFAQRMIVDHNNASNKLRAVLAGEHLPPPTPGYSGRQIAMLDALHGKHDGRFDHVYIHEQQQAHAQAVALFAHYAKYGDNRDLRKFAAKTLPVLENHQQMIDSFN